MKISKLYQNKKTAFFLGAAILILAFSLIIFSLYIFTKDISRNQIELGIERIEDVTQRSASNITWIMSEKIAFMNVIARGMEAVEDLRSPETIQYLSNIAKQTDFERLGIDFLNGESYTSDGHVVDIKRMSYFPKIKSKETFVTELVLAKIDGEPCISIIAPIFKDGEVIAAARGTIYTRNFEKLLAINLFDGQGYFHLVNSEGEYLAYQQNDNALLMNENYFDAIEKLTYDQGYDARQIVENIKNGKKGVSAYSYGEQKRYLSYMPTGVNDWYLMIMAPRWVIDKNVNYISKQVLYLIAKIAVILMGVFLLVLSLMKKSRDEITKINTQLLLGEKRYRFMLERSDNIIFEYTLENGVIDYTEKFMKIFGRTPIKTGLPATLMETDGIHFEDRANVMKLFRDVKAGQAESSVEMRILHGNGNYIWCFVAVVTIFDENEKPIKAFGVIENISDKKELELQYKEIQGYKNALSATMIYEVNLSKGKFISGYEDILKKLKVQCDNNYGEIVENVILKCSNGEHGPMAFEKIRVQSLMAAYLSGTSEIAMDICISSKKADWMRCKYKLYEEPASKDICAIISMLNITEQKQRELELLEKSQRDQLTGLYNKIATENLIKETLTEPDLMERIHAFLIIDIDDFKNINDTFGHLYGDIILTTLADKLKLLFRANDIVGRMGGDEFFVFMKNIITPEVVKNKAKEICEAFYNVYTENGVTCTISGSVGIALCPAHGTDFEQLYKNADAALYATKYAGKNHFSIYDGSAFAGYKSKRTAIDAEGGLPQKSFRENRIEYVFKLLYSSENPIAAVRSVLELIADHFDFSRGYIFEMSEDEMIFSNTFEWCAKNIEPEIDRRQNVLLETIVASKEDFMETGKYVLDNADNLASEVQRQAFAQHNIQAVLQFGIFEGVSLIGLIGFDECEDDRSVTKLEIDEIATICNVLGTFIAKQRAVQKAHSNYLSMLTILNNSEGFAYVVDGTSYELLFTNSQIQQIAPDAKVGECCYKTFMDRDTPCEICPLKGLYPNVIKNSVEIDNKKYKIYSRTTASRIDWINGKQACLISSMDISEYKYP